MSDGVLGTVGCHAVGIVGVVFCFVVVACDIGVASMAVGVAIVVVGAIGVVAWLVCMLAFRWL